MQTHTPLYPYLIAAQHCCQTRKIAYNKAMIIPIEEFENYADIIDTRTPAEFARDHLPNAVSFPVLGNAEHAAVGALGCHSTHAARRYGARLIAANISKFLAQPFFTSRPRGWSPLLYCARGGQRSGSAAEVMRRIGWMPQQLQGGYKSYRRYVLQQLPLLMSQHSFCVLAGKTGVGKTQLLAALAARGAPTIDLEALAEHRGSVFGNNGSGGVQPSQRRFETLLWLALKSLPAATPIFIESESRMIGRLRIPESLITKMHAGQCFYIDAPLAERVAFIQKKYHAFCENELLFNQTIESLRTFAGKEKIQQWQRDYQQQAWASLLADLLSDYYDKRYEKALQKNYAAAQTQAMMMNPNDDESVAATAQTILQQAGVSLCRARSATWQAK